MSLLRFAHVAPQVALVFGYHLSVYVEGELEELPGEDEAQQQPLPLSALQVNLGAARGRVLSGGRARAAAAAGVGAGGTLAPSLRVSFWGSRGRMMRLCEDSASKPGWRPCVWDLILFGTVVGMYQN
jgi:hypothetical protein